MPTPPSALAGLSSEVSKLISDAAPSVVAIEHKHHAQSGFYWRPDIVATASETLEVQKGHAVTVHTAAGAKTEGTIIGHDPSTDLALIRVTQTGKPIAGPTGQSAPIAVGHALVIVGRAAHGSVGHLGFVSLAGPAWRSMRGGDVSQRVWIDARMMRMAEGGAVVDTDGQLRGMAVFGPRRRVVLIPADTLDRAGAELEAHGKIRQGYLGVSVQAVPMPATNPDGSTTRATGLMVMGLDASGPAAVAGILRGDIIVSIGGETARSARALARLLPGSTIGKSKAVDLVRAGQPAHVTVTIGEHPAA